MSSGSRWAWKWAILASSLTGMAARLSPRTRAAPSASSMSVALASSRDAAAARSWCARRSAARAAAPPPITMDRLPLVPQAVAAGARGDDDLAGWVHPDVGGVVSGGHPHPSLRHGRGAVPGPLGEAGITDPGPAPLCPKPVALRVPAGLFDPLFGQVK